MQHLHIYMGPFTVKPRREIAWEAIPIPYSLTDLGRDYLMRLRVEEKTAESTVQHNRATDRTVHIGRGDDVAGV